MRVAMVTRDYPPKYGGIATYTKELTNHLRELGIDVDVFVGIKDLTTLSMPFMNNFNGYDIIHIQSPVYGLFQTKHPLVVTVHEPVLNEWPYYRMADRLKAPFAIFSEIITLRRADVVIAISQYTSNHLVNRYKTPNSKITVIPCGVDERFTVDNKDELNNVLVCSRLEERKNVIEVLNSFSKILCKYTLTIVGDGRQREYLVEKAKQYNLNVIFTGWVSENDLLKYFRSANIFISTSHSEGFGLSVLQAMACGCAVIVSNIPAHRSLVTHKKDGLIYLIPEELVSYLNLLLNDEVFTQKLGEEARKTAERYSWDEVASKTLNLYNEIVKEVLGK